MIGDIVRGWSWTAAILGLQAKTIHLCGDERALNLVSTLIQDNVKQDLIDQYAAIETKKSRKIRTKFSESLRVDKE